MSSNDVTITEQGHLVVGNVGIPAAVVPAIEAHYRAKFAAERMPEDVQTLVDGLRLDAGNYGRKMRGEIEPGETFSWDQSNVRAWEAADALEAAQRPPVAPEVREEVRAVVGEQLTKAGLDLNGPPYNDDGETQWPVALELRDRMTDALLARFSFPSQPVYDEEKIARWLAYVASDWTHDDCGDDDHPFGHTNWQAWLDEAAAFIAALRGGELTREETNE